MIEHAIVESAGGESSANAASLVDNQHAAPGSTEVASGNKPGQTSANHKNSASRWRRRDIGETHRFKTIGDNFAEPVGVIPRCGNSGVMARILVPETIAEEGLNLLRSGGHDVDVQTDLDDAGLRNAIVGADALIIRSATTVTEELLDAADQLIVVGRAGIGLDNVDVGAATKRGVMVVNAPQSNIISTAEQTMTLILAQARNTAAADASIRAGRWERSKWTGTELHGKTLGIVGLGRVGALVAQRAAAFGMKLIGYDPYVSPERARQLSVESVSLDELAARADVVTVHVVKTPDTVGLIGDDFLSKAKEGVRIINVARGGVVDEAALVRGLESGKVGGAGLDVFDNEPLVDSPLANFDNVVLTPHLGASTHEAQLKAGVTIAEQVALALAGDFVPFAVNVDAAEVAETVRPYLPLAEQLGATLGSLLDEVPTTIEISFEGEIGGYDNGLATLSALKGFMSVLIDEPVSYVNVKSLLAENHAAVETVSSPTSHDYVNRLALSAGGRRVAATLMGLRNEPRLVEIDGHDLDLPPSNHMIIVRNDDRPGMIGIVGTVLGDAGINVDDMDVGRSSEGGSAVMVIATAQEVGPDIVAQLRSTDGIASVDRIGLS